MNSVIYKVLLLVMYPNSHDGATRVQCSSIDRSTTDRDELQINKEINKLDKGKWYNGDLLRINNNSKKSKHLFLFF